MLRRGLRQCLNVRVYRKFSSKQVPEVSSNQSQSGWNWKEFGIGSVFTGACALLGTTYIEMRGNKEAILHDATQHLSPGDIQHSSTTSEEVSYMSWREIKLTSIALILRAKSPPYCTDRTRQTSILLCMDRRGLVNLFSSASVSMVRKGW
jgi:hypothetical protein